jgi:hypothetical protein
VRQKGPKTCQWRLLLWHGDAAALPGDAAAPLHPQASTALLACGPSVPCSVGNQPRVLPAVVRYLSDAGYKFDAEEDNPGLINVLIGC